MKQCSICREEKLESEFYKNKTRYDGLQTNCKNCNNIRNKKNYVDNPEYFKKKSFARNRNHRKSLQQEIIKYLNSHPCVDCGEADILVLDFDHVRGIKKANISSMRNYCWESVQEEIAKCEVRCSNCHRRKTANQFEWMKLDIKLGH